MKQILDFDEAQKQRMALVPIYQQTITKRRLSSSNKHKPQAPEKPKLSYDKILRGIKTMLRDGDLSFGVPQSEEKCETTDVHKKHQVTLHGHKTQPVNHGKGGKGKNAWYYEYWWLGT